MNYSFEDIAVDVPKFIIDCPIAAHWVDYNGKCKFAMLNYEESIKRGKAMIDLCYCATAGLINNRVEKTVPYSKARFKVYSINLVANPYTLKYRVFKLISNVEKQVKYI